MRQHSSASLICASNSVGPGGWEGWQGGHLPAVSPPCPFPGHCRTRGWDKGRPHITTRDARELSPIYRDAAAKRWHLCPRSHQRAGKRSPKPRSAWTQRVLSKSWEGTEHPRPPPPMAPTRDAEPTEPHTLRLYTILLYFPFVQNHVAPLYFTKPPPAHGDGERGREGTPQRAAPPAPAHLGPAGHGVRHRIPLPPVRPACSSQPQPPACKSYCHGGIINRLSEWVNSYYILGYSLIHPH